MIAKNKHHYGQIYEGGWWWLALVWSVYRYSAIALITNFLKTWIKFWLNYTTWWIFWALVVHLYIFKVSRLEWSFDWCSLFVLWKVTLLAYTLCIHRLVYVSSGWCFLLSSKAMVSLTFTSPLHNISSMCEDTLKLFFYF